MLVRMFRYISSITLVLALAAASAAQTPKPIEVAPGIALPAEGAVFGLDQGDNGPALLQIHAHEIHYNPHAGKNMLRGMVYAGPHATVEVPGVTSEALFLSTKPVLYVHLQGDDPDILRTRLHLLWLTPAGNTRVAIDMSSNVFGGHRHRNVDEVPSDITMIDGTYWVKITPQAPLVPGEFAVVFLPTDPNLFPDMVYDFTVAGDTPGMASSSSVKSHAKK
jgi:hypothetical protein